MPDNRSAQRRAAGEGTGAAVGVGDEAITANDTFSWTSGGAEVKLSRASDGWIVVYSVRGRLLGPSQVIYQGRHKDATHAAWDVMSRVKVHSRDDEKGLYVGKSAAQWIKRQPHWGDFAGTGQG
jgi:hypothetical protein